MKIRNSTKKKISLICSFGLQGDPSSGTMDLEIDDVKEIDDVVEIVDIMEFKDEI